MVVPTGRRERLKEDYCWIDSMMNRFCMFYLAKSQQLQILAQKFKKLAKCCKKLFSTFFADFEWIILQKCIFCKRFKFFFHLCDRSFHEANVHTSLSIFNFKHFHIDRNVSVFERNKSWTLICRFIETFCCCSVSISYLSRVHFQQKLSKHNV